MSFLQILILIINYNKIFVTLNTFIYLFIIIFVLYPKLALIFF